MEGLEAAFGSSDFRASLALYPVPLGELEVVFEAQQNDGFSPKDPPCRKLVDEEAF